MLPLAEIAAKSLRRQCYVEVVFACRRRHVPDDEDLQLRTTVCGQSSLASTVAASLRSPAVRLQLDSSPRLRLRDREEVSIGLVIRQLLDSNNSGVRLWYLPVSILRSVTAHCQPRSARHVGVACSDSKPILELILGNATYAELSSRRTPRDL